MKILSHRGYWKSVEEKNTEAAFARSFQLGFGTETDLRDFAGEIVLSHDPARGREMPLHKFLELHRQANPALPLALNIKSDGLQNLLAAALEDCGLSAYFAFDMSVPDALLYARKGLRFFTRQSEYETAPSLYNEAAGVWVDMFHSDWITEDTISRHLLEAKEVCLVSPDLHKRDHRAFWEKISAWSVTGDDRVMLCTDFPEEALQAFA